MHIWGSAEKALREERVGLSGAHGCRMTLRFLHQYRSFLPAINRSKFYWSGLHNKKPVRTVIQTEFNQHIVHFSLPIVDLPGKINEVVLLFSHYDLWHEEVITNVTGNALCLAVVAHFHLLQLQLKRGLRIAW